MTTASALIGHTGFVGQNLAAQFRFDAQFRSTDIDKMRGRSFGTVVCAGVQARKWWANQEPAQDWAGIQRLLDVLETIRVEHFVLISTVDVYPNPAKVTEETQIPESNHAYGVHRRKVEEFTQAKFPSCSIVRLPGLFGNHLKKNVIFDLLNDNCLSAINPLGVFQYYSLDTLWADILKTRESGIRLLNLATEPIRTAEIIDRWFPDKRQSVGEPKEVAGSYDMRSIYGALWGCPVPGYLYDRSAVLEAIDRFIGPRKKA